MHVNMQDIRYKEMLFLYNYEMLRQMKYSCILYAYMHWNKVSRQLHAQKRVGYVSKCKVNIMA